MAAGNDEKPRCRAEDCNRIARDAGLCARCRWLVNEGLLVLAGEPEWDGPAAQPQPAKPRKRPKVGSVPPNTAAALAADYAIARRVNGTTPTDSPAHEVNRRFNATLVELFAAGHTYVQIAEAAGASVHMVNKRLSKIHASLPAVKNPADPQPPIPEEMHGTGTGYRYGCRCPRCRRYHAEEHRKRRWTLRYGPGASMGPEVRERILDVLRRSGSIDDAVVEVQVKHQAIYSAARAVPEFGALVDKLTSVKGG